MMYFIHSVVTETSWWEFSELNTSQTLRRIFWLLVYYGLSTPAFLKLWSVDHKWSSGSALVVLLD